MTKEEWKKVDIHLYLLRRLILKLTDTKYL